jgi:CxxC-x17-CxxC domain-containing protein
MHTDSTLTCRDCGQPFVFTVREQEYYASRGFDNPPGRCPDCRAARKAERGAEHPSSSNRGAREMFSATCASCGKEAQVPFQPSGDRPVYCSDCYQDHRGSPSGSRSRGRGRY